MSARRALLELRSEYQHSLRLADHFHICPDCGRRQECDDSGQLCGHCEICEAIRKAEEYDFGPMFQDATGPCRHGWPCNRDICRQPEPKQEAQL